MSHSRESTPEAGLLRMLREALRAGLAAGADDEAFAMVRSSSQIIGLRGLEAGLDALEPHRGRPWSGAARELVDFLERLASQHDLPAFRAAEQDLLARAEALREWRAPVISESAPGTAGGPADGTSTADGPSPGGAEVAGEPEVEPPTGSLTAGEALAEMPLAGDRATERAARVWLSPHVGTALRAALEWLTGDLERPRPFRLRAEDSVLEVTCESVHPEGLTAAHEALAAAEGNLSPLGEIGAKATAGAWLVRVPAWSARPVHLMLEQGELRLAVPWHAVLRLSLVPSIEIELRGNSLATPVLAPLVPLLEGVGERPVVAIAHGLKRALLVADRLVWRLGAEFCEPSGPAPAAGLSRTVRSDEGEVFWVADPAVLLGETALPELPPRGHEKGKPPGGAPERPAAPRADATAKTSDAAIELRSEDVEPIALSRADVVPLAYPPAAPALPVAGAARRVAEDSARAHPAAVPAETETPGTAMLPDWLERFGTTGGPARAEAAAAPPAERRPGARGVLIAEDSIAARHFLARLFEQRGFAAHTVETAAELRAALGAREWSLACVDMELPDAAGRALMDEMLAYCSAQDLPMVALVRDDEDAELAGACGVRRWLRKPFDRDEVDHLLSRLGLLEEERS